jgi:hypothetical protein
MLSQLSLTAVYKFNHALHFARTEVLSLTIFHELLTVALNKAIPA